mmetsp:Transcript_47245/g.85182  ORF Transcript_47245/g.85182 Transcript_47245/m.85182 type:complete len:266 (-) Transcript_47245:737-1534(-)
MLSESMSRICVRSSSMEVLQVLRSCCSCSDSSSSREAFPLSAGLLAFWVLMSPSRASSVAPRLESACVRSCCSRARSCAILRTSPRHASRTSLTSMPRASCSRASSERSASTSDLRESLSLSNDLSSSWSLNSASLAPGFRETAEACTRAKRSSPSSCVTRLVSSRSASSSRFRSLRSSATAAPMRASMQASTQSMDAPAERAAASAAATECCFDCASVRLRRRLTACSSSLRPAVSISSRARSESSTARCRSTVKDNCSEPCRW